MDQRDELRSNQPLMNQPGIVEGLRVINVNLCDGMRSDIVCQQFASSNNRKPDVVQSSLIGSSSCIANDDRQNVRREVINVVSPDGRSQGRSGIATSDIEHDGRRTTEELSEAQRAGRRKFLNRRVGPLFCGDDIAWYRNTKLTLDDPLDSLEFLSQQGMIRHFLFACRGLLTLRRPASSGGRSVSAVNLPSSEE